MPTSPLPAFVSGDTWRGPILGAFVVFLAGFGVEAIGAFVLGVALPIPGSERAPYFGKYISWPIVSAILVPGFTLCYLRARQVCATIVPTLEREETLSVRDPAGLDAWLARLHPAGHVRRKLCWIAGISAATALAYFALAPWFRDPHSWGYDDGHLPLGYVKLAISWFQFAIVLLGFVDIVFASRALRRLLHPDEERSKLYEFELGFLHPDRCCGLSILGQYAKWVYLMGASLALLVSVTWIEKNLGQKPHGFLEILEDYPSLIVFSGAYLVAVPLFFFLPLSGAHRIMVRAKLESMRLISRSFHRLRAEVDRRLSDGDGILGTDLSSELDSLHKYQALIRKVPEWPLDTKTVSYVFTSVVLPVAIPLLVAGLMSLLR